MNDVTSSKQTEQQVFVKYLVYLFIYTIAILSLSAQRSAYVPSVSSFLNGLSDYAI